MKQVAIHPFNRIYSTDITLEQIQPDELYQNMDQCLKDLIDTKEKPRLIQFEIRNHVIKNDSIYIKSISSKKQDRSIEYEILVFKQNNSIHEELIAKSCYKIN